MNDPRHDDFERRVTELLATGTDALDGATRAALLRARRRAVASAASRTRPAWRYFAPAGVAAAVLLAFVLFMQPQLAPRSGDAALVDTGVDLDLLIDDEAWDIAQEADLEFIEWAAAMARQQGAGS